MPKEMSLSLEGREQKADAPTHNGARPHGKVRDFATRPQTHQYTKGDYFTLRSGERVLRLRGGGDFDDYGDSYNTGWNDDSYNTGWNNNPYRYEDTYNTGWDGDTYNTERDNDPYRYEDTYRYEELYKYEDPYRYEDPSDQWRKEPASTSDIYSEAIELLRERPGNMGDERRESDADPYRAAWSLQQWADELSSTRILSNAELEQLRECLLNEGNESRRGSGDKDGHHVVNSDEYDGGYSREELEAAREELEQRLRMLEIRDGVVEEEQHDGGEHDGRQGDGNGGGDGGYDSSRESDTGSVYSADGDPELRATRRPVFDLWKTDGVAIDGQTFILHHHAYNSLFTSGRKDVMPDDIADALSTEPGPGDPGSVRYFNPFTGTRVYVNPDTSTIVGVWPINFKSPDRR